MAGLALGVPTVSNLGPFSESIWEESGPVALTTGTGIPQLVDLAERVLADEHCRANLSARSIRLYADRFDVRWTIAALRNAPGERPS